MKILAASLPTSVDEFLHPGYGSVNNPWSFPNRALPPLGPPVAHMDMAKALELRDPEILTPPERSHAPPPAPVPPMATVTPAPVVSTGAVPSAPVSPAPPPAVPSWVFVAGASVLLLGAMAILPRRRAPRPVTIGRTLGAVALATLAAIALVRPHLRTAPTPMLPVPSAADVASSLPTVEPAASAESTPRPPYKDPHEATLAILHGLLADAVTSFFPNHISQAGLEVGRSDGPTSPPIERLADVKSEIALPTTHPTPGMRYALSHYEYDGWGRPFQLDRHDITRGSPGDLPGGHGETLPVYRITSAGEDGVFGNADDLAVEVVRLNERNALDHEWYTTRHAFFFVERGNAAFVIYHVAPERGGSEYPKEALALTGSERFGAISIDPYGEKRKRQLLKLSKVVPGGVSQDPLVFVAYRRSSFASWGRLYSLPWP